MKLPEKPLGGRPEHKPSIENRMTVEQMMACGDSQNTIARALGIDDDTLRKHYADELLNGAANRRREVVALVFAGARKGNSSLIKRLEEMTRAAEAMAGFDKPDETAAVPAKALKLGKKDARRQEAMVAGVGSDWGTDLDPPPGAITH